MKGSRFGFDFVRAEDAALLTDLYELTMCASYFENGINETATFDLFVRKMPENRSYLLFAGLEQVLHYLEGMRFTEEQLDYLGRLGFKPDFLEYLSKFRFTGEVCAVPEGTVVFPEEPLIRVTAPVIEAQIIETYLLNTVSLQTALCTKASRVVHAARGRSVIEFGLRRTQGMDAGMKAARCAYIAGCNGTSNVLAGMRYGIPVFGTMAHSYVMFFEREVDSFRAFARTFPKGSTFLIDTYDDLRGAENAVTVAKEMAREGHTLSAVRLDSGDLLSLSREVRAILDRNGLGHVKIFASGDMDEYRVDDLVGRGAMIDAFGVGTRMSTSVDAPYLDVVYKLAGRVEGGRFIPTMKLSRGKVTLPGKKQVFRQRDADGRYVMDLVCLEDEAVEGEPLLRRMMEGGELVRRLPSLEEIRQHASRSLGNLPDALKRLSGAPPYPVVLSSRLRQISENLSGRLREHNGVA